MPATLVRSAADAHVYRIAVEVLVGGGLVAFPTDTVYGLGSLVGDGRAVERIYAAKGRPPEKAIPVLLGVVDDLGRVTAAVTPLAEKLARRFWPGPLTLVLPKNPILPEAVSSGKTVGVRIPDHPVALSLLRQAGPLAVSSANRSGSASPCTADEVLQQLDGRIDLLIDGGRTPGGCPSTVVDCLGPDPQILRAGPITLDQLLAALGRNL
jgi:L-threonylcarbamoyladenylate synthase